MLKASAKLIRVDWVFNCEDKKFDNCLSRFEELELILLSISLNLSKLLDIFVWFSDDFLKAFKRFSKLS